MKDLDPGVREVVQPGSQEVLNYHKAKHVVYHKLYDDQLSYRKIMSST